MTSYLSRSAIVVKQILGISREAKDIARIIGIFAGTDNPYVKGSKLVTVQKYEHRTGTCSKYTFLTVTKCTPRHVHVKSDEMRYLKLDRLDGSQLKICHTSAPWYPLFHLGRCTEQNFDIAEYREVNPKHVARIKQDFWKPYTIIHALTTT